MILDVVSSEELFTCYFLFPVIIILLFFTVSRFIAYKENPSRKTIIQFIVLLVAFLITTVWFIVLFMHQPEPGPHNQWNNISTYHGDQSNDIG